MIFLPLTLRNPPLHECSHSLVVLLGARWWDFALPPHDRGRERRYRCNAGLDWIFHLVNTAYTLLQYGCRGPAYPHIPGWHTCSLLDAIICNLAAVSSSECRRWRFDSDYSGGEPQATVSVWAPQCRQNFLRSRPSRLHHLLHEPWPGQHVLNHRRLHRHLLSLDSLHWVHAMARDKTNVRHFQVTRTHRVVGRTRIEPGIAYLQRAQRGFPKPISITFLITLSKP